MSSCCMQQGCALLKAAESLKAASAWARARMLPTHGSSMRCVRPGHFPINLSLHSRYASSCMAPSNSRLALKVDTHFTPPSLLQLL